MERLLNVKEAAEIFKVSEMTIRRWTNGGALPCYRVGGRRERRFRRQDLQNYLDALVPQGTKANEMIRLGVDNALVPDGTHLTHLCASRTEALDIGAAYLREGLARQETVLLVSGKASMDIFINRLGTLGVDVAESSSQGKLHISHGIGTPSGMALFVAQTVAASEGRFRLFGDMTWVKGKKWRLETIRQFEEMGNSSPGSLGRLFLCQYLLSSFSGEELMMTSETHKYTFYKGVVRESPFFPVN